MSALRELAEPFPAKYIHSNPSGGGTYVKHHVVVQRLLSVCGPYDFEVLELIRGDVAGIEPNPQGRSDRAKKGTPPLTGAVVGAKCRLTVEIDGRRVSVEDVGDCEQPHNWPHDGARAKDATSDAIKRCAARIGLGLHLWSQDEYFLSDLLGQAAAPSVPNGDGQQHSDERSAQRPVQDVVSSAVTSTQPLPADPGADAYPGDDPDRKGTDTERRQLVSSITKLSTWRVTHDPDYELEHHEKLMTSVRNPDASLEQLGEWRRKSAARVDALGTKKPENGRGEPASERPTSDNGDTTSDPGDGAPEPRFHRWEMATLNECGFGDDDSRHKLARIVSAGRTESTGELSREERRRRVEIVRRFAAETLTPVYSGDGALQIVDPATGDLVDAWNLPEAAK